MYVKVSFLLIVIFGWVLFVGCANKDEALSELRGLRDYKDMIPDEEEINASLLHYEQLQDAIRSAYDEEEYYQVLSLIHNYYEVFYRIEASAFIDYYMGKAIQKVLHERDFYKHMEATHPDLRLLYGVKKREKYKAKSHPVLTYDKGHFSNIIQKRKGYLYEKKALKEVLFRALIKARTTSHLRGNLKQLKWALTHYPDAEAVRDVFEKKKMYFPAASSCKKKKTVSTISEIIPVV